LARANLKISKTTIQILSFLLLSHFLACGGDKPPSPPESLNAEKQEAGGETPGNAGTEGIAFYAGGADIAQDAQPVVQKCLDDRLFFDRLTPGDEADPNGIYGTCTEVPLAKIDCEVKGILGELNEQLTTDFNTLLETDYSGWLVDQCIDCSPDNTFKDCKNDRNQQKVGTKIFFVIEDLEQGVIKRKGMTLPIRPNQE
jgi:hypothetical protein